MNMLIKFIFYLFLTVIVCTCSDDNSTSSNNNSNGDTFNIVGTWNATEIEPFGAVSGASTWVFKSDGSYTWFYKLHNWDLNSESDYTLNRNTLTCNVFPLINGNSNTSVIITTPDENTFSFLDSDNNRWTYTREP